MQATIPVTHRPFLGEGSNDGYPGARQYGPPVNRLAYLVQPESQDAVTDDEHAGRVVTRKLVGVPSAAPYNVYDEVMVAAKPYVVIEVRDMSTGPFGYQPGGALIVERVDG